MKRLLVLTVIVATALLAFPRAQDQARLFSTGTPAELVLAQSMGVERLRATAVQRGIADELVVSRVDVDAMSMAHTRVQQRVRGVPVFGGEAIAHFRSDGELLAVTDDLVPNVSVDTTPRISRDAAIDIAVADYGCVNCFTAPPTADLWILRDRGVDHLTYRVQMRRLDGTNDTALPVQFVDAQGGFIVLAYDNLQTGTGSSLYSGTVTIGTSFNAGFGQYVLENLVRRVGTFDSRNSTGQTVFRFLDADDVWNSTAQRAGVDAHFGAERFLDYLQVVHGRHGIDGQGGPFAIGAHDGSGGLIASRVHFGTNYNNAFWDGIAMTYGDGDGVTFSPLVTLDIAAHEMTHGLTQFTAGLIYQGESGALNESWSDVFAALAERHVKGASASNWLIAEDAFTPGVGGDALRHLDDPHRVQNGGFTADDDPDHYSERYTGPLDNGGLHINSGIANKAFYLLAQGGTHHLGGSMTGIGADAAGRIWFSALTSFMTSNTNFAGARTATLNAATALYGSGSAERAAVSAAWCLVGVGVCGTPTADSVTPSAGSGTTQVFALKYSDSEGASNLSQTWVWFNATQASSANSCLVYYARSTNTLLLLNDAGTVWGSGILGTATPLQNSQCAVALASSSASPSGTTLTLNLAITFKAAFNGAKNIYMYAANTAGTGSGWQDRGDWTVTGGAGAAVTADSVTPSSGTGAAQTFALAYSSTLGATNLSETWVWFNATQASSAASSCLVYYARSTNTLLLLNDAATVWDSASLGSAGTLQNSQCAIALASSSASPSGTTLTLNLAITFKAAFNGAKNIYMYGTNGTVNSGWQDRGDWTVNAAGDAVTADSVTPSSGTGAAQTFALAYSSTLGATNLSETWVWFNATQASSAASSCLVYYARSTNTLLLLNDAATVWDSASLGSAGTLQNSQCAIALASSSASPSGTTLTLNLAITFKAAFNGAKNIYMYGTNGTVNSGWQDRGDWTVNAAGDAVTADSVTPSSGTGAAQTFALAYSSTFGATNLSETWVWFNATQASSAASSCLVYYARSTNTLLLLNDAATVWDSASLGSAGTLQNSQCAIALASSSASPSGNTLTVTLAVTFSGGYAGAKNIFMYGTNGVLNSGWQDRGDWIVP